MGEFNSHLNEIYRDLKSVNVRKLKSNVEAKFQHDKYPDLSHYRVYHTLED